MHAVRWPAQGAGQGKLCHFKLLNVTQKSSAARMHCGGAITKHSTNKLLSLSIVASVAHRQHLAHAPPESASAFLRLPRTLLRPNAKYPSSTLIFNGRVKKPNKTDLWFVVAVKTLNSKLLRLRVVTTACNRGVSESFNLK